MERKKRGIISSTIGIVINILLALTKIIVGIFFSLVSVVADGFNNLSDCGSSIVSLISFHISDKPADEKHPYGHNRAEYIASMITGFIVLFLALELIRESIEKIFVNNSSTSWIVYLVLSISIIVKAGMFIFYKIMSKKLNSDVLKAAYIDSLCDCISTIAVLIGVLILQFTKFPADCVAGLLVSLFIIWQGVRILKEASSKLLGQAPDKELFSKIKEIISNKEGILGFHDLQVYNYGSNVNYAIVHIEMDASLSSIDAHAIIDELEQEIQKSLNISITIHLDPIDLKDEEMIELEKKIKALVNSLFEGIEMHDFRIIRGKFNKLVFEVAVPFSYKKKDEEIKAEIEKLIEHITDYEQKIMIERK